MTSPWEQYQHDLNSESILPDPSQAIAMQALDKLYQKLLRESVWRRRITPFIRKQKTIKGCYLWGGVGTGKSYLLNIFFQSLPFTQKKRLHFHEFMQQVHTELKALQGQSDPLKKLAKEWAKHIYVLCLDEFLVKDIADAMILGHLLEALFSSGVCLVTTANIPPHNLYKNGLQRERFLPAIKLLQEQVTVLEVDNNTDYRRATFSLNHTYFSPLNAESQHALQRCFAHYTVDKIVLNTALLINERELYCVAYSEKILWCQFSDLCATRTGAADYLQIAKQFPIVLLSEVPLLTDQPLDVVLRFINLIDVLYDAHIELIISAEVAIDQLYSEGKLAFEFQRTASRLTEMQTQEYRDVNIAH
jgi:cell division protein ZapE